MANAPQPGFNRQAAGYKALQRITVAIRSHIDLGRVLDILTADAGRLLDLSLCSVGRWDPEGRALLFSCEYRRSPAGGGHLTLQGRSFEPGAEPAAAKFEDLLFKEHMSLISTTPSGAAARGAAFLSDLAGSAYVVTPMIADQRLIGLLIAARSADLQAWSEDDVEFLRTAADMAAVCMQHAAMRSQLRVISAVAAEINSCIGERDLLRRLTESAMSVTQSTVGAAGLVEGDHLVCREMCRAGVWSPIDVRLVRNQGLAGWVWTNRAPCVANDARSDPRAEPDLVIRYGVRSALAIPIVNRYGEVLGFFEMQNKAAGVPYGEQDIHLASSLAHHAALALEVRKN
ncbi:MAG TPA: GAF domain-containing protein [Patescibacteria group bacterium]|nr:GAF domain-containing protein [Patescibacteria group bacterium]